MPDKTHSDFSGIDVDAPRDTVYNVGLNIEENADGSLSSITVGISNDEHQFGYVNTTSVTGDKNENAEAENTEAENTEAAE